MNRNRSHSRSSSQSSRRESSNRDSLVEPSKRLFIGGISSSIDREDLRQMFEEVGSLQDFFMKRQEGKDTFAFLEFNSIEQAEKAIDRFNGKKIGDRALFVTYSRPRAKKEGQEERGGNGGFRGGDRDRGNRGDRGDRGDRRDRGDRNGGYDHKNQREERKPRFEKNEGFKSRDSYGQGKSNYQKSERSNFEGYGHKEEEKVVSNDFDY